MRNPKINKNVFNFDINAFMKFYYDLPVSSDGVKCFFISKLTSYWVAVAVDSTIDSRY